MSSAPERLGRPALRPLVVELGRRLQDDGRPVTISMATLTGECLEALADLLGTERVSRTGGRLAVARLLGALQLDDVDALRQVVESLLGPLPRPAATRRAELERREELWSWLAAEASGISLGGSLDGWVGIQRARGARRGVDQRRRQLETALAVLRRLPADGVALASLAAEEAGGPHGLDRGTALAGIVLEAVAAAAGRARPVDAEEIRDQWESVGVAPDPLSSTVTVLGLPGDGSPLGAWLAEARRVSEPVSLSLANLRRWPRPALPAGDVAVVVENPSLVAEAAAAGWDGPPLVCSSGRPTVAVVTLLRQLGAGGARLCQHADFDPAGVGITGWLQDRAGTVPWRMSAADYGSVQTSRDATFNEVPPTPWDPDLSEAMAKRGVPVYEEEVRVELLAAARAL